MDVRTPYTITLISRFKFELKLTNLTLSTTTTTNFDDGQILYYTIFLRVRADVDTAYVRKTI